MGLARGGPFAAMVDDPDDYRPSSMWLLQVDPERSTPMAVIRERIAAGDRIPRHWHDVDEVVLYEGGRAVIYLNGEEVEVGAGDTLFIPAGAVHGTRNVGTEPVELRAVFPRSLVRLDMVERNPLPGTEAQPPQATVYDLATGEFEALGPTDLTMEWRARRDSNPKPSDP